jgi:chromosome segregation protein
VGSGLERISQALDAAAAALQRAQVAEGAGERASEVARVREASERAAGGARRIEELLGRRRQDSLESRIVAATGLLEELGAVLEAAGEARDAVGERAAEAERRMLDRQDADDATAQLRECSQAEAQLQATLHSSVDSVTEAEVRATQLRDRRNEAAAELGQIAERLGREIEPATDELTAEERHEIERKLERLARRRESLGPVNPLAEQEYADALAHVNQLEEQRGDLEAALAELQGLIRDTDQRIRGAFEETFEATQRNFEELTEHLFPGGRGRLRLVGEQGPRLVLGGERDEAEAEEDGGEDQGVEIEVTPAGKATRRLSLLSGGEKALVALAFVFAVFLARPSPFYILDEVEAALDDANIDRFLQLVRRFSGRAQFVIVTHQKRTMDAADVLYGVSMGEGGITKVISRRLSHDEESAEPDQAAEAA